mmetsp:Transcript_28250/g.90981  ORF Transcript_28250/g.90981 Transcript_28250/m.90981 type:complete len:85 (-) Transcript_28250:1879-2133(-)
MSKCHQTQPEKEQRREVIGDAQRCQVDQARVSREVMGTHSDARSIKPESASTCCPARFRCAARPGARTPTAAARASPLPRRRSR